MLIPIDRPQTARKWISAALFSFVLLTVPTRWATAQDLGEAGESFGTIADLILPETTQLTLGFGLQHKPDYIGSDEYRVSTKEVFFIRYEDLFTIDNTGASLTLLKILGDISFGPVVRFESGRKEKRNDALTGLGNICNSWELVGFVKANLWEAAVARARFRWGVSGHEAFLMDLQLSRIMLTDAHWAPLMEKSWAIVANVNSTYSGGKYANQFFGITPEQSLTSGRLPYEIGGGFRDIGGEIVFRWEIGKRWGLVVSGRYNRLLGAFADSPLVALDGSSNQWRLTTVVTYTFGVTDLKKLVSPD